MKNNNQLSDLLKKIKVQYELLEKIPIGVKFYEAYSEYYDTAFELNTILKLEDLDTVKAKTGETFFESYFGYITFKVVPLISLLQEQKKLIFKKLPDNDDKWFINLQYHFSKLATMEGDRDFGLWFGRTEVLLNNFLDKIETTEKGNKFFIETNIMNVMHEIMDYLKVKKLQNEVETPCLEQIKEKDIHRLITLYKKLPKDKKEDKIFDLSLKNKGELGLMSIYAEQTDTKEQLMLPIHIYQSKVATSKKVLETSEENTVTTKNKAGLFEYRSDEKIYFNNKSIDGLEAREFKIFLCLMQKPNLPVMYSELSEASSSNGDPVSKSSLQKYVSPLHQKLKMVLKKEDKKFTGDVITTVPKNGYRLEAKKVQEFFTKK